MASTAALPGRGYLPYLMDLALKRKSNPGKVFALAALRRRRRYLATLKAKFDPLLPFADNAGNFRC
ncbi:hypothetical protein BC360_16870 [Ensifer sp. LC163]|nr:hypothetical protein BC360_16870 [Ensifer sp. LC163]